MPLNLTIADPQVIIYLTPIQKRLDNKRSDERSTLEALLNSGVITEIPQNIGIIHQSNGSPIFSEDIGLGISISHSDHILAIAIYENTYRVGIDIEERAEQAALIIRRVASESELALMKTFQLHPIILWSAKEATFKAFSDKVITMSGQVVLKDCTPDINTLTLNVIKNNRKQALIEVQYIDTFNEMPSLRSFLPEHPFVLAIASNIPQPKVTIKTLP